MGIAKYLLNYRVIRQLNDNIIVIKILAFNNTQFTGLNQVCQKTCIHLNKLLGK